MKLPQLILVFFLVGCSVAKNDAISVARSDLEELVAEHGAISNVVLDRAVQVALSETDKEQGVTERWCISFAFKGPDRYEEIVAAHTIHHVTKSGSAWISNADLGGDYKTYEPFYEYDWASCLLQE